MYRSQLTLRGVRRVLPWVLVVPLVPWTATRLLGLEHGYPGMPLMAFTPYATAVAVLVTLVVALLRVRAASLAAGACALALVAVVAPRALGGPSGAEGGDGRALTVLSLNLRYGGADPDAVRALVRRTGADVVSLQEVTREAARGLRGLLPHAVVRTGERAYGTALYARFALRAEPDLPRTQNAIAVARATVGGTPVEFVAVHPPAPLNGPRVARNRSEVPRLPPATDGVVRILAGDFNTSLDHHVLRELIGTGYEDAAEQLGAGLRPTWPVGRRVLPVTIDHVLADARCGWSAYRVFTVPHTDHRAILARLVLPKAIAGAG